MSGDEEKEPKESGVELRVRLDMNKGSLKEFTQKGLQTKILEGTVNYMLNELTEDRMKVFLNELLNGALSNIGMWDIQRAIEAQRKTVIEAYIEQPAVKARIKAAIEEAVEKAIGKMPTDLHEAIISEFHASARRGLGLDRR